MYAIYRKHTVKEIDQNGGHFKAQQGEVYTTTMPKAGVTDIIVFSNFWVKVSKDHFVALELGE